MQLKIIKAAAGYFEHFNTDIILFWQEVLSSHKYE